jgi:hypothetical protein
MPQSGLRIREVSSDVRHVADVQDSHLARGPYVGPMKIPSEAAALAAIPDDCNEAQWVCQGDRSRVSLRFYNHHFLPRVCLTLVGRQKEIDGMGNDRAPQR